MRLHHALLGTAMLAAAPAYAQMQPRDLGPDGGPPAQQQGQQPPPQRQPQPPQPPPTPPPPQPPQAQQQGQQPQGQVWQTIETTNFGQWTYSALRHSQNGSASCALHTHWHETGRQLRIVALEQPIVLSIMLSDPRWSLREDARSSGSVQVDSQNFTANFARVGSSALAAPLATGSDPVRNFLQAFRGGTTMRVTLPGDAFVAGLRGSSQAMDAMTRCIGQHFGQRQQQPGPPPRPGGK